MQEMRVVIRALLTRCELTPGSGRPEQTGRRSITFSPSGGATVVLRDRAAQPSPPGDRTLVTV
jgi:hypothetical protein